VAKAAAFEVEQTKPARAEVSVVVRANVAGAIGEERPGLVERVGDSRHFVAGRVRDLDADSTHQRRDCLELGGQLPWGWQGLTIARANPCTELQVALEPARGLIVEATKRHGVVAQALLCQSGIRAQKQVGQAWTRTCIFQDQQSKVSVCTQQSRCQIAQLGGLR